MEEKNKKQQLVVRICCVIAAFGLWLYIFNVENPIKESKITVPVEVVNRDSLQQSKLAIKGDNALTAVLDLKGSAYDIDNVRSDQFKLQLDLSQYGVKKGENNLPVQIKKGPDNVKVVNSENLWVRITLEQLVEKSLGVTIELEGKAKDGFYSLEPVYQTKNILASGPSSYMEELSGVTAKVNLNNSSKTINSVCSLTAEDKDGNELNDIDLKPNSILVQVPVKKVKSVGINIKTIGTLNNGGSLKSIIPSIDKIDIAGDENVLGTINSINTETIDLSKINGKDTINAKLIVPKGITLVNSSGTVSLKLYYNNLVQKTINLDIQVKNLAGSLTSVLTTAKAAVVVSGSQNAISNLKDTDVTCFVNLDSLSVGEHDVPVDVSLPDGVTKISIDPAAVRVSISKKTLEGKNGN